MSQKITRRRFLEIAGLGGATAAFMAACAPTAVPAPSQAPAATTAPVPTTAPAASQPVTLDVVHTLPENNSAFRQIFDIFEAENPGVKINQIAHSEDGQNAYAAKVAGGFVPALEMTVSTSDQFVINQDTYKGFVNLAELDFPYWDRFTYDAKNAWSDRYGIPGVYAIDVFSGLIWTWVYNEELMKKAGLNPRDEVKTWEDFEKFLDAGTKWAKSKDSGVSFFWDRGWNQGLGEHLMHVLALSFPEGTYEQQLKAHKGEIKLNGPDSPYRKPLEFFKRASDNGWLPENYWTRGWDNDMEASFVAGKSVLLDHGHWIFDKVAAGNPGMSVLGFPMNPPAAGSKQWLQWQGAPSIDRNLSWMMRIENKNKPHWDLAQKLFVWWHRPDIVEKRAYAEGRPLNYKLDKPLELKMRQWTAVAKDIGQPGGKWEQVKYESRDVGADVARYRKAGTPGIWETESGNNPTYFANLSTGKWTVQDFLDQIQKNWEVSYPELSGKKM